ncbi:serine hydrolase domain-containing protein [Streptomyces sp. NBC_00503]|uniref:serine hydrolase domain-containing protein n=1 Tax=Streptomyces sp. NBC_00503 TaxID=2903659 RepID=UPI002E819755|nr:serine hydrolase domain-containing protein [Streptomyces sp. NBC_00503]WUD83875.1 beta-lactamase family protein [Streptomyces sp. NBC_00503]
MNATTRTLIATALVLGVAAGPAVAHAAPAPGAVSGTVSAAIASPAGPAAPTVSTPPNAAALEKAIAGLGPQNKDATAALVRVGGTSGSWQGSSGVADIRTGREAVEQGRFRAGSVTKTFTSSVVLQLAAEGRVDLNKPVRQYLPDTVPDAYAAVTVRQLLNHTSGIPWADGPGDSFEAQWEHRFDVTDPHDQLANALAKKPEFTPGAAQHYLNINYTLLGVLIEKVTGTTYEEAVGRRILKPLGLHGTSFPGRPQTKIHGPHNQGYQAVEKADGSRELRDVTEWNSSDRWAAGDIISTTADLERFTIALFSGRVVPKAQLEEMFTVPGVKDFDSGEDATLTAGMSRIALPDGTVAWGKTGSRYGYNTAMGATRDLSRTLVYSVNSTDAKGEGMNAVAFGIVKAAFRK